ncbi:signal transduction histidine kinase, nitrogen specific, NtrB [Methylobacterium sp. 4-46]|uniref:ATP-binding protein n=1 Tax=unclassified Methylobacterium TaxID=2615210 RepID=UPI000152E5C4|nr:MULTISPECIES: ATP-binding protein [Methylobacterium]ACA19430.1 signal transduction histidine kinase, nitrogen specific, NtrB [Methylobacterium sp. 4-46]WFT78629.1 ATP-binding protein [Methylobacterium nodulans]
MSDLLAPEAAPEAPFALIWTALGASPLPSLLLGRDGAIRRANAAAARALGEEPEALAGQALAALGADAENAGALRALLRGDAAASADLLLRRRDGCSFWASLHLSPIDGAPDLRLVQWLDVSRRRDLESALAQAQRREALGQLTNGVAHEFNNLLQILVGYVDGLKRRLGEHPDPFVQRALTRATDAAERASALTRHLLAFSRKHRPEPRATDLNALLRGCEPRARAILGEGVALTLALDEALWPACLDPVQTEFILAVVLTNAREAMPEGGRVTLTTANHGGEGVAADGTLGRHVVLTIADTGSGMPPEVLARALEPFFTTREPGRGTGLAILHALMKRQGGAVGLRSTLGEGTILRLSFPAADPPRPPRPGAAA